MQHRRQNAATTQLVGVDSHFLIVFGLGGVTILQGSGGRHIIFGGLIEKFLDERGFATTFFTDKDQSLRIRSGSESYTQEVKKGLGEYLAASQVINYSILTLNINLRGFGVLGFWGFGFRV